MQQFAFSNGVIGASFTVNLNDDDLHVVKGATVQLVATKEEVRKFYECLSLWLYPPTATPENPTTPIDAAVTNVPPAVVADAPTTPVTPSAAASTPAAPVDVASVPTSTDPTVMATADEQEHAFKVAAVWKKACELLDAIAADPLTVDDITAIISMLPTEKLKAAADSMVVSLPDHIREMVETFLKV